MEVSLEMMSTEVLIKIFGYLDICDLCKLRQTCVRFNYIITSCLHLIVKNNFLVTNQLKPTAIRRSQRPLDLIEKIKISHNWKIGKYKEKSLLRESKKTIPCLILSNRFLWISRGKYIKSFEIRNNKINIQKPIYTLSLQHADICKFKRKEDYILSGHGDGSISLWSHDKGQLIFEHSNCHLSDINAVDLGNKIFVTGSRDKFVKVWPLQEEKSENYTYISELHLNDRVWSTSFSEDTPHLFVGTSGCSAPPIYIIDINRFSEVSALGCNLRKGSGILDARWETANIIWSCGYDACLRRWDLRTGKCEQYWEDPFYSPLYCLDYDDFCTALTGCQSHGRVVLWDTRQKNYVQMYFMESCKSGKSSPVYNLSFDVSHLYAVTDRTLSMLDFSISNAAPRDYSNLFYKEIKVFA